LAYALVLLCIFTPLVASATTKSKLKSTSKSTTSSSSSVVASPTQEKFIFSKKTPKGDYVLTYVGLMVAGAIARSVSATAIHPLNVIKIMLQKQGGKMPELNFQTMTRGAGSQFIMSIPHGAINFVITEVHIYMHYCMFQI
jgi:hypothetical protein